MPTAHRPGAHSHGFRDGSAASPTAIAHVVDDTTSASTAPGPPRPPSGGWCERSRFPRPDRLVGIVAGDKLGRFDHGDCGGADHGDRGAKRSRAADNRHAADRSRADDHGGADARRHSSRTGNSTKHDQPWQLT
jgi:hypothetical protein